MGGLVLYMKPLRWHRAYPVGRDPFAGGVRQNSCQIDPAGALVDGGGLYHGDLMLAASSCLRSRARSRAAHNESLYRKAP